MHYRCTFFWVTALFDAKINECKLTSEYKVNASSSSNWAQWLKFTSKYNLILKSYSTWSYSNTTTSNQRPEKRERMFKKICFLLHYSLYFTLGLLFAFGWQNQLKITKWFPDFRVHLIISWARYECAFGAHVNKIVALEVKITADKKKNQFLLRTNQSTRD